jgi:hypothetical protein
MSESPRPQARSSLAPFFLILSMALMIGSIILSQRAFFLSQQARLRSLQLQQQGLPRQYYQPSRR